MMPVRAMLVNAIPGWMIRGMNDVNQGDTRLDNANQGDTRLDNVNHGDTRLDNANQSTMSLTVSMRDCRALLMMNL